MRASGLLLTALLGLVVDSGPAQAHEGPPFPILVDRWAGPYLVSLWTDPDVGTGTVFVVLEAAGGAPYEPPRRVRIAVQPVSRRLPETVYDAETESVRRGGRYVALVSLDRPEVFRILARIDTESRAFEVGAEVEATPAVSIGPIGLLVYALPFLALAAIWIRVSIVKRRLPDAPPASAD
jgi:hypothetical protein